MLLVGVTRLPHRIAFTLLVLATALQLADTTGHLRAAAEHRALGFNSPLKSAFWTVAPARYQRLTLVPSNICSPAIFFDARPFILLAGRHQLAINAGAAARFDASKVQQHCADLGAELRQGIVTDDQLYVLSRDTATMFKRAASLALVCTTEDGFSVCFSAQSYAVWQDTYDVVTAGWPSLADLTAFVSDLDDEYRTTLQRGPLQAPGSAESRVKAIVRYLAHRTRGCTHTEAQAAAVRDTRGGELPGVCSELAMTAGELPPPNETLDFRRSLERVSHESQTMTRSSTHVDPEGEAVWVQEYARARLAGATHSAARNQVLRRVRN